jgi:hypothetical protein
MQRIETSSSGRNMPIIVLIVLAALAALGLFFVLPG